MGAYRWRVWTGSAAIVGGLVAVVLTPAFATAYFLAYPGFDALPFWFTALEPRLGPVLSFSSPAAVYTTYGRVFDVVFVLFLPSVLALHRLHRLHHGSGPQVETWGFRILVVGLVAAFVGVAGDYWADGIGFPVELLGLLLMAVGSTAYGVALLRSGVLPRWCAGMLVACGPASVGATLLIGHVPSGPTLPFAVFEVTVGSLLLLDKIPKLA